MRKTTSIIALFIAFTFTNCQLNRRSMRESNYQLWLNKTDISYTEQREGIATQSKFLGIDWERLFARKFEYGGIGDLPSEGGLQTGGVVSGGSILGNNGSNLATINSIITSTIGLNSVSKTEQFAINDLIVKNPGYDLIMFPQFEVKKKWYIFGSKTEVKVKARLAKITPDKL